ncbi:MAG: DUF4397 domain-containing protein [Woeseia sp.]
MTIVSSSIALRPIVLMAAVSLMLGGCSESTRPEATGKGNIRGIHAVPTAPEVTFLIEERALGNVTYKNVTSAQEFDDLTYNFNFDTRLPGDSGLTRIATETVTVVPDTNYDFVLTGTVNAPSIVLWETAERQWDGAETVLEVSAGHLASGTAAVDIYFAPPGTAPVLGSARGTLSFGDRLPAFEAENGEYRLIVTEQGNPAAVLFTSTTRDYTERTSVLFTIQDADPSITSGLSVRRIEQSSNSVEVGDATFPPTRRFFNSAFGSGIIDIYVDDDFVTPIVSNLVHGGLSADVPVPAGESTYTYTAVGNPGAILLEDEDTVVANTRGTNYVTGEAGDLEIAVFADDRRPVTGFAKIRVTQVAASFDSVDAYLVAADIDIADVGPNLPRLGANASSGYLHLNPGNYELTVTEVGEKTVLAGPVPISLASGGIVETAIIDTADPNQLNVVIY